MQDSPVDSQTALSQIDSQISPVDNSALADIDSGSIPSHDFGQAPLDNISAERDELAKQWLSSSDSQYVQTLQPRNVEEFQRIKSRAAQSGLTIDDVMSAAEEKAPAYRAASWKAYRNGGPLYRGVHGGIDSVSSTLASHAYRGLSNIPGLEWLATASDDENRYRDVSAQIQDTLDREGSLAQILPPAAVSVIGQAATGITEIAAASALPGMGAEAATDVATAKAAALTASKKMALYYGLKSSESALTAGTDAGLTPNMRIANASVIGGINAVFTYGFGNIAQQLGYSTAEQAISAGNPAVSKLLTRTGLYDAAVNMGISAGEQATMDAAQMGWGAVIGTDNRTSDERWASILHSAEVGAVTRGAADLIPSPHSDFKDAYEKTQDALPDTVRGTLDAQKASEQGTKLEVPETASPAYKDAVQSHLDYLDGITKSANEALAEVKVGEESLKDRVAAFLEAKKQLKAVGETGSDHAKMLDAGLIEPRKPDEPWESYKARVQQAIEEQAAGTEKSASVPFMVTQKMKQHLAELGFSAEEIKSMKPADAHAELQKAAGVDSRTDAEKLQFEQDAIKSQRDELATKRKKAEDDLKSVQDLLDGLSDGEKEGIKSKVIETAEVNRRVAETKDHNDRLTRAENAANAKFRERYGLDEMPESDQVSTMESLKNARAKGLVQRADEIAGGIVNEGKAMGSDEQQGIREAAIQRGELVEKADAARKNPDLSDAERNDATIAWREAMKSTDLLSRALGTGRSEAGRVLAQGQKDLFDPINVREHFRQLARGEVSDTVLEAATEAAVDIKNTREYEQILRGVKSEIESGLTREEFVNRELLRKEAQKRAELTDEEKSSTAEMADKVYTNACK